MRYFILQNPKAGEGTAVTDFHPLNPIRGEAPRCPACGKFVGMLPLLPPVRVELETWGSMFGDIAFGPGDELLLTQRFLNEFRASGLTGLTEVSPAEVVKVTKHRKFVGGAPNYYCCRVVQSRAAIDVHASGLVWEKHWGCEVCRLGGNIKRAQRIVLEPNSWSGEDIFLARGLPGMVLASERFERFCQDNRISNCVLIPAEEYSFDFYPWERDEH